MQFHAHAHAGTQMIAHANPQTQEQVVYEWTHTLLSALSGWVIPVCAACCALAYRALSARRMVTTVLVSPSPLLD